MGQFGGQEYQGRGGRGIIGVLVRVQAERARVAAKMTWSCRTCFRLQPSKPAAGDLPLVLSERPTARLHPITI